MKQVETVRRGRPTALTPELARQIAEGALAGHYLTVVCRTLGVPYKTWQRWKRRGDLERAAGLGPEDSVYVLLVEGVEMAEGLAEQAAVQVWTSAFEDDWRAAKEFLARRYPARWGDPQHRVPEGEEQVVEVRLLVGGPDDDAYKFPLDEPVEAEAED